jgi:hypothetical protein
MDVTQHLKTGTPVQSRTINLPYPEGEIAELFRAHALAYPDVAMGSYPQKLGEQLSTQLVLRSTDAPRLAEAEHNLLQLLVKNGLMVN